MRFGFTALSIACVGLVVLSCRSREPAVQSLAKYSGQSLEQVVAELGQPVQVSSFKMGDRLDEMRLELLNVLPLNKPGNETIEIKEAVWRAGDYYTTIWFHRVQEIWVVVDGVRWHKDVRF